MDIHWHCETLLSSWWSHKVKPGLGPVRSISFYSIWHYCFTQSFSQSLHFIHYRFNFQRWCNDTTEGPVPSIVIPDGCDIDMKQLWRGPRGREAALVTAAWVSVTRCVTSSVTPAGSIASWILFRHWPPVTGSALGICRPRAAFKFSDQFGTWVKDCCIFRHSSTDFLGISLAVDFNYKSDCDMLHLPCLFKKSINKIPIFTGNRRKKPVLLE